MKRFKDDILAGLAACIIGGLIIGATAFILTRPDDEADRIEKIKACVERGGEPIYEDGINGHITEYFGCREATP